MGTLAHQAGGLRKVGVAHVITLVLAGLSMLFAGKGQQSNVHPAAILCTLVVYTIESIKLLEPV